MQSQELTVILTEVLIVLSIIIILVTMILAPTSQNI